MSLNRGVPRVRTVIATVTDVIVRLVRKLSLRNPAQV